ncbi:SUMO-activating enzyme subunit 2, putative [Hepatocystis sp. ex Piliocolobus tephrosceles]|nr:SUMO-activating enzyme subunit 2, putative [Hepatocystis sp. ex Piliocolobus tephrosceles]
MHKTMRKMFDSRICEKIENMKILLVGAGGIGSEFLKNIITMGCKNIDIIDIDTIDITNLNRQFLFKKKDIKKYKAFVAKEKALSHNTDLNINAYTFDVCTMNSSDISKYDYIVNALDNIKARTYVNKLCIMENKVLIEAGSTGYNGQVYPIYSNETKCYNCEEKPKNKTYAICTIRQTPTLPEHCVAWGKLIYETFFCKNDNETMIDIKNHIEEETKKRNMYKEEIIIFIFNYLFYDNIKQLFDLKKNYAIMPQPIHFNEQSVVIHNKENIVEGIGIEVGEDSNVKADSVKADSVKADSGKADSGKADSVKADSGKADSVNVKCTNTKCIDEKCTNTKCIDEKCTDSYIGQTNNDKTFSNRIQLQSKKIWNKEECIKIYFEIFKKLYEYLNINKKTEKYLIFDKDDDYCINFITAISNLRMLNFSINRISKFDVQSIAGNIIPAISSTNAIVASLQGVQLIHTIEYFEILKKNNEKLNIRDSKAKHVWIKSVVNGNKIFVRGNLVNSEKLEKPNPKCLICQQPIVTIYIKNFQKMTLYDFVKNLCMNELKFLYPCLDKNDRNIFDYDTFAEGIEEYIDSLYNSLHEWGIKNGEVLILTDYHNDKDQVEIYLKENNLLQNEYILDYTMFQKEKTILDPLTDTDKGIKKRKHDAMDDAMKDDMLQINKKKKDNEQVEEIEEIEEIADIGIIEEIVIDDNENKNENIFLID